MDQPVGRIKRVFISRLNQLMKAIEESKSISHSATKGALRESYLREIFDDIMPPAISVGSGFICDCFGTISPQIDFLIAERHNMPSLTLMKDVALVPIETAIYAIEMKSRIEKGALKQLKTQFEQCGKMEPLIMLEGSAHYNNAAMDIFFSLVGLESSLVKEELKSWFKEIPPLQNICVIGGFALQRRAYGSNDVDLVEGGCFQETLFYFSSLINNAFDVIERRRAFTRGKGLGRVWTQHITGPNIDPQEEDVQSKLRNNKS